jgi:hypothetical protein
MVNKKNVLIDIDDMTHQRIRILKLCVGKDLTIK